MDIQTHEGHYPITLHREKTDFTQKTCISEEELDEIAEKHAFVLPLIFGKWSFFKENGVKDIIAKRFIRAVAGSHLSSSFPTNVRETEKKTQDMDKYTEEYFEELYGEALTPAQKGMDEALRKVYDPRLSQTMRELTNKTLGLFSVGFIDERFKDEREESMFLLQVLRKDSDLKAYIDNELNEIEKEYTQYLANVKSWKQQLGDLI